MNIACNDVCDSLNEFRAQNGERNRRILLQDFTFTLSVALFHSFFSSFFIFTWPQHNLIFWQCLHNALLRLDKTLCYGGKVPQKGIRQEDCGQRLEPTVTMPQGLWLTLAVLLALSFCSLLSHINAVIFCTHFYYYKLLRGTDHPDILERDEPREIEFSSVSFTFLSCW